MFAEVCFMSLFFDGTAATTAAVAAWINFFMDER